MKMSKKAVPELVFPILLPLCESMLFQHFVSGNNQQRCTGFKTHTTLNTDNSVANMHIATYGVWSHK